jgi:hypothetical protein
MLFGKKNHLQNFKFKNKLTKNRFIKKECNNKENNNNGLTISIISLCTTFVITTWSIYLQGTNDTQLANINSALQIQQETRKTELQQSLFVNNELSKRKLEAFKKVLDLMDRYIPYRIENIDQPYKSWSLHYRSLYIKKQKKPSIDEIREAYNLVYVYSNNPNTISDFIDCIGRYSGQFLPQKDPLLAYHDLRNDIRKELSLQPLDSNSSTLLNDSDSDWNHSADFSYIISDYHFNDALLNYNRNPKLESEHNLDYLVQPQSIPKGMKKSDLNKYHKYLKNK